MNQKRTARVAGFFYLLFGLPGFFGLIYVPSTLFVRADPAATVLRLETIAARSAAESHAG